MINHGCMPLSCVGFDRSCGQRTKLTDRERTRRPLADHATLRNATVGPSHRDDQTSADLEAQCGDTEEEVLRSIVVNNGHLGNEGLELAMPECEGAGPVNGFTLSNQAPCCHLTSSGGDPAVEDKVITRAVATCVGKTRPPIAPPQTFVARV